MQKRHQVTAIDGFPTGRLQNIQHRQPLSHFYFVPETMASAHVLDRLTGEVESVIHLATAVGVKLIVENPVRTIETNIKGTEMVLNAANRRDFYVPSWMWCAPSDPGRY